MPSPAIATIRPSLFSRVTVSAFPAGSTPATTSSIPSSLRHGLGGRLRVAREHHDTNLEVMHSGDRGPRGRPDRIRRGEEPGGLAVHGDEENRLAVRARGVRFRENICGERRRETKIFFE